MIKWQQKIHFLIKKELIGKALISRRQLIGLKSLRVRERKLQILGLSLMVLAFVHGRQECDTHAVLVRSRIIHYF